MAELRRDTDIAKDLDALYGGPLEDFTSERNALAKRLRDEGKRAEADEVRALRKPSVPAGAINRGVRADAGAAKRLLEAGERLRSAHEDALRGGGADELREAMAGEAGAVEEMAQAVRAASGKGEMGPAMLDRVRDTLRAVAGDEDLRAEFEAGRVVRDRKPVGIGGGLAPGSGRTRRERRPRPAAARRRKAEQRLARAEKALAEATEAARAAAADLKRARRDLKAAESRAERAEARRAKADAALQKERGKQG